MKSFLLLLLFLSAYPLLALDKDHKTYISKQRDETMVYLPAGTFRMASKRVKLGGDDPVPMVVSVNGFFISPYETSNFEYLEYVMYLKASGYEEEYQSALPDTTVWRTPLSYNEPYVDYYFRHPAYRHCPVVGITHKQASDYCVWLTKVYNEYPKRKYKKAVFRLPSKAEWYYAACIRMDEKVKKDAPHEKYVVIDYPPLFPWDGTSMQNPDGSWRANFSPVAQSSVRMFEGVLTVDTVTLQERYLLAEKGSEEYFSIPGDLNDYIEIIAPVFTFGKNAFGLYNMAGNVEEFVADYGITKGGSWYDTGFYLCNDVEETYDASNEASSQRGFRVVMDVLEEW